MNANGLTLGGLAVVFLIAAAADGLASRSNTRTLRATYGMTPATEVVSPRTALALVDFQEEFFSGKLPIPDGQRAVDRAAKLLAWARASAITIVHVQNVATRADAPLFAPGSPTIATVPALAPAPGEIVVTKSMSGAFSRTNLDTQLRARGIDTLVVAGFMTHLAVDSTARDATVLGYHVIVAGDATATRDLPGAAGNPVVDHRTMQRAALAALADRFADVMDAEQVTRLRVLR